jgi:hypothetical protein
LVIVIRHFPVPRTERYVGGALVKVVVTRIGPDSSLWRRMIDTAGRGDRGQWEASIARALVTEPPYRPLPGGLVWHVRVDDRVIMVAEDDLAGPLRDLVTAILAAGEPV